MAHVVVTEGLVDRDVRRRALRGLRGVGPSSSPGPRTAPRRWSRGHRRPGRGAAGRRPAVRHRPQLGDLLRPRRHRAQPGLDDGHGHGQPGDGHGQHRPRAASGVNPLRGQNNVQGSCDMGSFPHELPGYRHVSDDTVRERVRDAVGPTDPRRSRGCGSRTCSTPRSTARSAGCSSRARTSPSPTRTPST